MFYFKEHNTYLRDHMRTSTVIVSFQGLLHYDGSTERSAIRCLESLFKAISNLSLYTPNIQPFLDAGEDFYSWHEDFYSWHCCNPFSPFCNESGSSWQPVCQHMFFAHQPTLKLRRLVFLCVYEGIENAYSAWLSNLTEDFPDAQLETGCRTLANLVMENDPNNMRKFGVCLLPCMQVGYSDGLILGH